MSCEFFSGCVYSVPSREGLGVCDKQLLIHSEEHCAALPLHKGDLDFAQDDKAGENPR